MLRALASVRVLQLCWVNSAHSVASQLLPRHCFCGKPRTLASASCGCDSFAPNESECTADQVDPTWRQDYTWTDAVVHLPTTDPPTALQWAKRRGPGLHHGLLHSLFRKRKIKLFLSSGSKIKTIPEHFQLPEGSQLLIPHQALPTRQASRSSANKPDLTTPAALALCNKLRHSVLYRDEELLVINKPQGLAVQGGHKIMLSLDKIMHSALALNSDDTLRLVHRLDKDASGCLVIARTADSAAWLSQAFAQHSNAALNPNLAHAGATVQREYLALVEQSGQLATQPQGTITDPLRGPGGSLQTATTLYKTLSSNDEVALLRLTPKTGRKHQLRLHAASALSAPILGDARHGSTRNSTHDELAKAVYDFMMHVQQKPTNDQAAALKASTDTAWTRKSSLPLQLHCHSVRIQKPHRAEIALQAEPSQSMSVLLKLFRWTPPLNGVSSS